MGAQRIVVLAMMVLTVLVVGFAGVSWQMQQTSPTANDSAQYNESYELGTGVTEGVLNVLGIGIPILLGIAVMATAFGLLILAYKSGGR